MYKADGGAQACTLPMWKAEAGGLFRDWGQAGLKRENLSYTHRKKEIKKYKEGGRKEEEQRKQK